MRVGLLTTLWQCVAPFGEVTPSWAGVPIIGTASPGPPELAASQSLLVLAAVIAVASLAGKSVD